MSVTICETVEAYIEMRTMGDGISTQPGTEAQSLLSGQMIYRIISPVYSVEGQAGFMEVHTRPVTLNATGTAMLPVMALLDIIRAGMDPMEAIVSTVATGEAAETSLLVNLDYEHDL